MTNRDILSVVVCVRPPLVDDTAPTTGRVLGTLDQRAVDYAVRLARRGDIAVRVTAVTAGASRAVAAVRECLAMGVDDAVHVLVDDQPQADGWAVAQHLAAAIADLEPQLVLCGSRSDVGMHGTVPRALARLLGFPFVSNVVELDIDHGGSVSSARAAQRLERGDRWAWGCDLPMVCAVERDLCAPRYLAVRRLARVHDVAPAMRHSAPLQETADPRPALVVESRNPPRIRPKKAAAPTAAMSPADRLKFLRGGKAPAASTDDAEDKPRRVAGDPDHCATEIVKLLEKHELL